MYNTATYTHVNVEKKANSQVRLDAHWPLRLRLV